MNPNGGQQWISHLDISENSNEHNFLENRDIWINIFFQNYLLNEPDLRVSPIYFQIVTPNCKSKTKN